MSAGRCLSDLPDDLLRRILSLAPAKEAAATAVLSRRWRSLWRTCGAVNMDSRSYGRRLDAFFRGAEAALAAASAPVRRLTIYVELEDEDKREMATYWSRTKRAGQVLHDMIGAVLSNPAARQVEELRVGALMFGRASANVFTGLGLGALSYGAHHPSEALRVLHLTNCSSFTPPPPGTSSFPQLKEMRLQWCSVPCAELQGMIDAAPLLATLRLEFVDLSSDDEITLDDRRARCYMLRCPAVTALVLENCACPWVPDGIELDTPRLRYLRFEGPVSLERVSLKPHAQILDRVDLHFDDHGPVRSHFVEPVCSSKVRMPFWQFLGGFSKAKVLKLKLDYPIDHIAIADKELGALLGDTLFSNLERLELEGTYDADSKEDPGIAIANLLNCFPVLRDLRLKLSKTRPRQTASDLLHFASTKAQSDFNESVDHFKRRRILLFDDEDGDDSSYEVSDIPALSEHSFNCLHKHLRRVSLQFRMEEPNCFVAQLAKFFTKNAVLLEEMYIDDGEHRIREHLSRKVVRSERRDASLPAQRESGGDCLSKLGDGVLGHILSFLPAFQAAQATVLSRRWRHIFGFVHTISLDRYWKKPRVGVLWPSVPRAGVPATFGDIISAALLGRHRGGVPLRKLHIALRHFHGVTPAMVDQWLSCAMELDGGEFHLDLRLGGSLACSLGRRRGSFPAAGRLHATCGGEREDDDEEDEDYPVLLLTHNDDAIPRSIPVPTRIFSCVVLRSLRLGPCQLHLPATIDLPCLETLLLTGVVGPGAGAQVQRLVTACPHLADLTLEACAKLTTLSVIDKRLRRLALRCCHGLAAVAADASELRVLEYRGVVPAATPSFLTMHGPPRISSCTLDLCGEELTDPSRLRDFLHLFACAKHLHFKSAQLGFGVDHDVFSYAPAFPTFASLRRLELTGLSPRDCADVVTPVTKILEQTPSLETLTLFFLPELRKKGASSSSPDREAIVDLDKLRYYRHVALAVPDGVAIPCVTQRVREINLVHYRAAVSQRTLAKFLLRNAPALEELCCTFAPGPLWMQTELMEEMKSWVMNKSTKLMFV